MSVSAAVAAGAATLARAVLVRTAAFARRTLLRDPPYGECEEDTDHSKDN